LTALADVTILRTQMNVRGLFETHLMCVAQPMRYKASAHARVGRGATQIGPRGGA
jgi:hypothetical protein